ncbi:hypothetical protein OHA18_08370 [Kribbella sp. NBC_00709]|uniref:DUF6928 family protein n=1 Tax=Kribbella sp. NBC_00709 TaxID=2975972 RepID=UPI002E2CB8B5|nr:hypothetical protein [Kribbella sp. NBC_00709]
MGAKDWMIMYADTDVAGVLRRHPPIDRAATRALVARLHPDTSLIPIADGTLADQSNPEDGTVYAGVYPGLTVLLTEEAAHDRPSRLSQRFIDEARGRKVYLHAMHSVVGWFAYAVWENGALQRSLSLSPDDGILERIGDPLPFEQPYWAGERAEEGDDAAWAEFTKFVVVEGATKAAQPFDFNPLELGEDALSALFGFVYEGTPPDDAPDLERIVLAGYRLS